MPDILVRGLNQKTVQRLKRQAKAHNRSLHAEVKTLLEGDEAERMARARALAEALSKRTRPFKYTDSAILQAEGRRR